MKHLFYFLVAISLFFACNSPSKSMETKSLSSIENDIESSDALHWLKSVFQCEGENQFCFPNEEEILTDRFKDFLAESNQFFINASGKSSGELNHLKAELEQKWSGVYPLLNEETWPFGRGNGDMEFLKDVKIKSLENNDFQVDIEYSEDFSTSNLVKVVEVNNRFFIDFIETKYEMTSSASMNQKENAPNVYHFTQKWTWKYKNETSEEILDTYEGEMSAYYNPETKNWLFTKESYGNSGEMVNWVIGQPNGTYTYSFQSVHKEDPSSIMVMNAEEPNHTFELEELYKPVSKTKIFNQNSEFDEMIGKAYERVFGKSTIDKSVVYLAETSANMTAFYRFNDVDSETKLLYWFDLKMPNLVYLQEDATLSGDQKKIKLEFLGISKADNKVEIN